MPDYSWAHIHFYLVAFVEIKRYPKLKVDPIPATDEQDDLRIAPLQGCAPKQMQAEWRNPWLPPTDAELVQLEGSLSDRRTFTLLEALALISIACTSLSLSTYVPVQVFAGGMGFTILTTLCLLYWLPRAIQESRIFWLVWWAMALIYLAAVVPAVLGV